MADRAVKVIVYGVAVTLVNGDEVTDLTTLSDDELNTAGKLMEEFGLDAYEIGPDVFPGYQRLLDEQRRRFQEKHPRGSLTPFISSMAG